MPLVGRNGQTYFPQNDPLGLNRPDLSMSPGARRFHDKYDSILDDMFQRYGFNRMPPGTLRRAKEEFELRQKLERERQQQMQDDILNSVLNMNLQKQPSAKENMTVDQKKDDGDDGFFEDLWDAVKAVPSDVADSFSRFDTFLQGINPFDDVSWEEADKIMTQQDKKFNEKNKENMDKFSTLSSSFLDSATLGAMDLLPGYEESKTELEKRTDGLKGLDILGSLTGYLIPGTAAVKGARALGAGAKAVSGASKLKRAGQLAKEGSVAGALFGTAEAGIKEITDPEERTLAEHMQRIMLETAIGAVADPVLDPIFQKMKKLWQGWRSGNVETQEAKVGFERLVSEGREQLPNLGVSEKTPFNVQAQPTDFSSLMDDLGSRSIQTNPDISFSSFATKPRQQITEIDNALEDLRLGLGELEDDFVQQGIRPFSQAEQELAAMKELNTEYLRVRDELGRITIPEANRSDWQNEVPLAFRAAQGNQRPTDLYSAAEQFGYNDVDEFVSYLQRLDEAHKAVTGRKKDFVGVSRLSEAENALREQFSRSEDAQGISSMMDSLMGERKGLEGEPQVGVNAKATQPLGNNLDSYFGLTRPKTQVRLERPVSGDDILDHGNKAERVTDNIDKGISNWFNRFIKTWVDDSVYAKVAESKLTERKRFREGSGPFHMSLSNARGAQGTAERALKEYLVPTMKRLTKQGYSTQDGYNYVYAKHLLETIQQAKKNGKSYTLPKGVTVDNLKATVQKYQDNPAVQEFAEGLQTLQRNILKFLNETGYIDDKHMQNLIEMYPNYLPKFKVKDLNDLADDESVQDVLAQMFGKSGGTKNPIQALQDGSFEKISDPIDNITRYTLNAYFAGMRNKALQELANFEGMKIGDVTVVKQVPDTSSGDNVIKVHEDGEVNYYQIQSDVRQAIDSLNGIIEPEKVMSWIQGLGKIQSMSITANPVFATSNHLKDMIQGYTTGNFSIFRDYPAAVISVITNGKYLDKKGWIDKFYYHGAGQSTVTSYDNNGFYELQKYSRKNKGSENIKEYSVDKSKDLWGGVMDKLRSYSEVAELVPKFAQFRAVARKTGDLDKAAYSSRDQFDFMKQGTFVRRANRFIRFLNATIQGREKYTRSFFERPLATFAKSVVVGAVPSGLAYMAYKTYASDEQKQVIDEAPQWQEDTNWLIPSPFNEKDVIQIPKPFEVAAFFSSPVEWMLRHDDEYSFNMEEEMASWIHENILIDPTLNPATPVYEAITGTDTFTGRSIVPREKQNVEPIEQQDVYTSSTAKWIANVMNKIPVANETGLASPMQVENFIEGFSPVTGQAVNDVIDRFMEQIGVRENVKPGKVGDNPVESINNSPLGEIWNQFMVKTEGNTSTILGDLYKSQQQMQTARKKLRDEGTADTYKYPRIYSLLNDAEKQAGELANMIEYIENNPELSKEEKRKKRNQLIEERNTLVRKMAERGFFSSDPQELKQLEQSLTGIVDVDDDQVYVDRTDNLMQKLKAKGVSEQEVRQILDNPNLSAPEKKQAILNLVR